MPEYDGSFSRINYLLRPSKQVERKLIIEAMQRLAIHGYDVPSYRYIGLGSIYYADIVLFHKYLLIDDLLCVEKRPIERRMKLNRPFDFVDLHMGAISEVLPTLDRTRRSLLWLDYDEPLSAEHLADLTSALTVLAPGSVFLITVTAQLMEVERAATLEDMKARSDRLVGEFSEFLGRLIPDGIDARMLSRKNLPKLFSLALRNQTLEQIALRTDQQLQFCQLFNYQYSDGATMLTFGGLLDTTSRIEELRAAGFPTGEFAATEVEPMIISVPPLTVREKNWLDQNLSTSDEILDEQIELGKNARDNYKRFYRYYPNFYETLT